MNIIVTVDENWAIGKGDRQFVQIPADQRNMQRLTAGATIVMGRKTLQAQPQGQPLYGRDNIILSEKLSFKVKGATVVHSMEELHDALKGAKGEVYVCGGESLYSSLLTECDTAFVTMIEKNYDANRYFENLDKSSEWVLAEESDEQTYFDITYYFRKYVRTR